MSRYLLLCRGARRFPKIANTTEIRIYAPRFIAVIAGTCPLLIITLIMSSTSVNASAHSDDGRTPPSPLYLEITSPDIAAVMYRAQVDIMPIIDVGFSILEAITAPMSETAKNIITVRQMPNSIVRPFVLPSPVRVLDLFIKKPPNSLTQYYSEHSFFMTIICFPL